MPEARAERGPAQLPPFVRQALGRWPVVPIPRHGPDNPNHRPLGNAKAFPTDEQHPVNPVLTLPGRDVTLRQSPVVIGAGLTIGWAANDDIEGPVGEWQLDGVCS